MNKPPQNSLIFFRDVKKLYFQKDKFFFTLKYSTRTINLSRNNNYYYYKKSIKLKKINLIESISKNRSYYFSATLKNKNIGIDNTTDINNDNTDDLAFLSSLKDIHKDEINNEEERIEYEVYSSAKNLNNKEKESDDIFNLNEKKKLRKSTIYINNNKLDGSYIAAAALFYCLEIYSPFPVLLNNSKSDNQGIGIEQIDDKNFGFFDAYIGYKNPKTELNLPYQIKFFSFASPSRKNIKDLNENDKNFLMRKLKYNNYGYSNPGNIFKLHSNTIIRKVLSTYMPIYKIDASISSAELISYINDRIYENYIFPFELVNNFPRSNQHPSMNSSSNLHSTSYSNDVLEAIKKNPLQFNVNYPFNLMDEIEDLKTLNNFKLSMFNPDRCDILASIIMRESFYIKSLILKYYQLFTKCYNLVKSSTYDHLELYRKDQTNPSQNLLVVPKKLDVHPRYLLSIIYNLENKFGKTGMIKAISYRNLKQSAMLQEVFLKFSNTPRSLVYHKKDTPKTFKNNIFDNITVIRNELTQKLKMKLQRIDFTNDNENIDKKLSLIYANSISFFNSDKVSSTGNNTLIASESIEFTNNFFQFMEKKLYNKFVYLIHPCIINKWEGYVIRIIPRNYSGIKILPNSVKSFSTYFYLTEALFEKDDLHNILEQL